MMNRFNIIAVLISFLGLSNTLFAIDPQDTRLLTQPTISANHIAFIYAEDLWVANRDGSQPRRLTIDEGIESNPRFSPDGAIIAFSAEYDGNIDVFTVPVEGGVPKRLTWHPGWDFVRGFTPDGTAVLFISQRATFTNRYAQLFTVSTEGGNPNKLEIPNASVATYSPDGKFMAYNPYFPAFPQWKHYRGGTTSEIWIFSFEDHSMIKIPQPTGRCNDTDPMWIGNEIYFRSDRNGEFNLFSYDITSKAVKQLTTYTDFAVMQASAGNGTIIFEQAGYLHTMRPGSANTTKLTVGIATDLLELRPRYVSGSNYIRWGDISPSGKRAVFDFRGEVITVPAEKGDARNLTQSPGVHERFPTWSPDGKSIAYISDQSGENKMYIASQDGKGTPTEINLNGAGFYAYLRWSPDGKKIAFVDNGRNLYILDVASKAITQVDADEMYVPGPYRNSFGDWSSDSKWIVYTKIIETNYERVYMYSLEEGKSYSVTDGLSNVSSPSFDPSGKYLYFLASTDAGPVVNWFDQSNADMNMSSSIYLVTLQKEVISPFAKESDEAEIKEEEETPAESPTEKKSSKKGKKATEEKSETEEDDSWKVDFDGIENRIIDVPVRAGNYRNLRSAQEGKILYIASSPDFSGPSMLHQYDLEEREDKAVMPMSDYEISADGKKMLYFHQGKIGITATGKKPAAGKGILKTGSIKVKIDPKAEWENIFDEAWRVNRDYFYDPGMHGADWPAMKEKYKPFLADLSCKSDLYRVMRWMHSELAVGHHRFGQGDRMNNPERVGGGLLGVDYVIANGRYQFAKIYGGLNWTPNLRSPLTEPGVNVNEGDYLLAVNGEDVSVNQNLYSFFENTAGKIVELTVGPNVDYSDSRVVKVTPIRNEYSLRNRDWVEGNMKKVHEATDGQVAYVYVPNTAGLGHQYFKRYFFPQANKKAIIVDERFNGGGQLADYYIDILLRPHQAHWNFRHGKDLKSPSASIQGPKVMIIDETAGSGGDMLPWMFRKFGVGTLVGKRTWGGLVGILGYPEFIDGGVVTAPNVAIWTEDGFIVENVGVAPDIEVEQDPAEIIKGNDPQLEKAIEIALEELKKNPPKEPVRPAYPIRVKK